VDIKLELDKQRSIISLDNLLEILGNPTRRIILSKLAKVPLGASELAASFGTRISRQAIHQQLKTLVDFNIIESFGDDPRNIKYRIKSNMSLRIDITPDYYSVNYNMAQLDINDDYLNLKDLDCKVEFDRIKKPNNKLRFLGEKIKDTESEIRRLEEQRKKLIQNKERLIIELKNIMKHQYESLLKDKEQPNLEKEIFYTLFYDPIRYFNRINIDKLVEDMFFSEMGPIRRDSVKLSIRHLLRDLSNFMDFLREDEDDWFFDI